MTYESLVTSRYVTGSLRPWPRDIPFRIRAAAFIGAVSELLWIDLCKARGYKHVRRAVTATRLAKTQSSYDALTLVRVAVRDACVFYFKQAHCLQRSAAVTRMLRRRGIDVEMVVGCQPTPVESHAWVERNGAVIWDGTTNMHRYKVIDRF